MQLNGQISTYQGDAEKSQAEKPVKGASRSIGEMNGYDRSYEKNDYGRQHDNAASDVGDHQRQALQLTGPLYCLHQPHLERGQPIVELFASYLMIHGKTSRQAVIRRRSMSSSSEKICGRVHTFGR
jgi:hypothetical protein